MAEGFGLDAISWAARLPKNLALIASDYVTSPTALARIAERKRAGTCIAGTLILPNLRALVATGNAAKILADVSDPDKRTELFTALANESLEANGIAQRDWFAFDSGLLMSGREFLATCDVWVARSAVETEHVRNIINYSPERIIVAAPKDALVPAPPNERYTNSGKIVVWAPHATREQCAIFAFALESLRSPVVILCRESGPPLSGLRATFCAAMQSAALLSKASVIVDASVDDPGSSGALAGYGIPLAAAKTSGAHEWLHPIHQYLPWNARSIFDAVLTALGGDGARPTRDDDGATMVGSALKAADDALPVTGPLVSIIVPTYNRPERLRNALRSVSNQRYDALEIVVVNDGGADVSAITAEFPNARLIDNFRNLGVTSSMNAGIAQARGEYLGFLADDDFLQPDHVPRLVAALERSGLDVAHSKEIHSHYDVGASGREILLGHHLGAPSPTHLDQMLVSNRIGGPCVMVRRRALLAVGSFDAGMRHGSDFEMWMRLARRHDFVFVNHVTAHMSMRNDTSQLSSVSGLETAAIVKRIYDKHPVGGRMDLEAQRNASLATLDNAEVVRSSPAKVLRALDLTELAARSREDSVFAPA